MTVAVKGALGKAHWVHWAPNAEPRPPDWGLGSEPYRVARAQAQTLTYCSHFLFCKSHFLLLSWFEPSWATQTSGKTGSGPGQEVIDQATELGLVTGLLPEPLCSIPGLLPKKGEFSLLLTPVEGAAVLWPCVPCGRRLDFHLQEAAGVWCKHFLWGNISCHCPVRLAPCLNTHNNVSQIGEGKWKTIPLNVEKNIMARIECEPCLVRIWVPQTGN